METAFASNKTFLNSKAETGRRLGGISIRTVERLVQSRKLVAVKLGRRTLITEKSIQRLLQEVER